MKNWMLVCCFERDIMTPQFFKSFEEAYAQMRIQFVEFMDWEPDSLDEYLAESDSSCGLTKMFAYGEHSGNCCDWRIFNLTGRV